MFVWAYKLADLIVYRLFNLSQGSKLGQALHFFIYDSIKIFVLLTVIIYVIGIIRSFFPPEKTKKILSREKNLYIGNILAALLGIVTPFCSCSAVPMFIGFVEAGVPLGVTFSFLISSPMVNEVALVLLWGMFGFKIALIYIITGVIVAVIAGIIIGKLNLEKYVEEYVYQIHLDGEDKIYVPTWRERSFMAWNNVKDILKRIWPYVLIAIAIGGFIHGYVPEGLLAKYAGKNNPFAVPVAVLFGIPLYSNAAGVIPIVKVLVDKGVAMGTVLSFMMAVTALSLPEMIILRRVLKPQLLGIFVGIMAVAIIFVGYLFNFILA